MTSSYIIMEWLEGEPLSRSPRREGMLPVDRALHIAHGIGRALGAAHARGIVHRDLKPDNVFLVARGEDNDFVKVLDFGIAKLLQSEGQTATRRPSPPRRRRAPARSSARRSYMSPEQCRGVAVDAAQRHLLARRHPLPDARGRAAVRGRGARRALLEHMTEPPPPPRELSPVIPEHVERAVLRGLEKDPAQRYALVTDFLRDLGAPISSAVRMLQSEPAIAPQSAGRAAVVGAIDTIGGASGEAVPAPRPRQRVATWMIALPALAAVAVAVVLVARPHDNGGKLEVRKADELVPAAPTPVAASPTPAPTAPPTPATVRFAVRTTPPSAQLEIDGVVRVSPYVTDAPADGRLYDVRASAPGFAAYHASVKLDRPQDLDIVLDADASAHHHADARHPHALPAPPGVTPNVKAEPKPEVKPGIAPMAGPIPGSKPMDAKKKDDRTYQGTKGTLITDFPESN